MADLVETIFPHVAKAEGAVTHLYLDSKGHLTIGYGHLVFHRDDLGKADSRQALTREIRKLWPYNVSSVPSHRESILIGRKYVRACSAQPAGLHSFVQSKAPAWSAPPRTDAVPQAVGWGFVQPRPAPPPLPPEPGHNVETMVDEAQEMMMTIPYGETIPAHIFRSSTSFEISPADILRLCHDDIRQKIKEVKAQPNLKDFDSFPLEGQLAVFDLAYQGGAKMIAEKYKGGEFDKAALGRRWYDAWKLCPGPKENWPPESRQKLRRKWLTDALLTDPKAHAGNLYMYRTEALGQIECTKNH